ncbi:MAG: phosphoenolpyruvate--protein phosphotransferase [Candidatus Omnitrophica bacterium]|nr:phosphoenolpyruvate--protein phosphotransferase [Candidatus Omnitrophota bacterium]
MKRDHSKLICDIGELTALFTDAANLDTLLQNIVDMAALHMAADVCSVYLFEEQSRELVLKATHGLLPGSVGQVRLRVGEGLTGTAFSELRAVCEGDAARHPGYRFFPGIGEEQYCSFLAVPILRGRNSIGVMTLQSVRKNYFSPDDINVFRAITSQLATVIEMARLLLSLGRTPESAAATATDAAGLKFVKGLVGAEGFALGESLVVTPLSLDDFGDSDFRDDLTAEDLHRAVVAAEKELMEMQLAVEKKLQDVSSFIFSAQILMLKDQGMLGAMESLISQGRTPPEAVRQVVGQYVARFDRMSNEYVREKRYDVMDVGRRILQHLAGHQDGGGHHAAKVVIIRELLPSDVLKLSLQNVAGVVLLSGGVTSHVAVLSRSLNIPLVIADESRLLALPNGTRIMLDGSQGNIFIDPDDEVVQKFREKEELRANVAQVRAKMLDQTRTRDGVRVTLLANINLLGDIAIARDFKAEGIGLYRTEFPFMVRSTFPTEEEQYLIYRRLVEGMKGREITFRTLDIGGDKMLSYYDYSKEANPFLGLRSIRFSLRHREIFVQQLRAILRAGFDSGVRIMFPMISSLDEFEAARTVVRECLAALKAEGKPHQSHPVIGMMVELPSVLEVIDELAVQAEFFSVGTNDLIQYMLAVDRTNEKVADLYLPHHPAVLRSLKRVAEAALRHGRDLSVCGDMAHDPRYVPFLVGIGVRKFSLDARYLAKVQACITALDTREAEAFAAGLLRGATLGETARAMECFPAAGEQQ